ncbi:MAG: hypothetical protein LBJ41_10275 [Treponema sp.]|nr:hypothetical protein [Treponema sp.]
MAARVKLPWKCRQREEAENVQSKPSDWLKLQALAFRHGVTDKARITFT